MNPFSLTSGFQKYLSNQPTTTTTTTNTNTSKNMANPFGIAAAGIGFLGGIFSSFGSAKRARAAEGKAADFQRQFDTALAGRQDIINPYANV